MMWMEVSRTEALNEWLLRWLTGDETRFGGGEPPAQPETSSSGPASQSAISNGSLSDARTTRRHFAPLHGVQGTSLQKLWLCLLFHSMQL